MGESKSPALPLGDAPIYLSGMRRDDSRADYLRQRRSIERQTGHFNTVEAVRRPKRNWPSVHLPCIFMAAEVLPSPKTPHDQYRLGPARQLRAARFRGNT